MVDPVSGDRLVERVAGPVERVMLERSYHVATLDYDKDEIEARTVDFVAGRLPPRRVSRGRSRPLSRDDVVHVARLARLSLEPTTRSTSSPPSCARCSTTPPTWPPWTCPTWRPRPTRCRS